MEQGMRPTTSWTAARVAILSLIVVSILIGGSSRAYSEGLHYSGWGVRGGFSSSPDQFIVGAHLDLGELAQNVRLVPNADIGFGNNWTFFTLNGDVVYELKLSNAGRLYFGGALALVYAKAAEVKIMGYTVGGGSDTNFGVAGVFGYKIPSKNLPLSLEMRVGITDEYPDLKFLVGYTFLP